MGPFPFHALLQRLLIGAALPLGLMAAGSLGAHAGTVTVTGANSANGVYPAAGGGPATATATTGMFQQQRLRTLPRRPGARRQRRRVFQILPP